MKLRDIIGAAGNRLDWIHFDWNWEVGDGGNIIPTLPVELNVNSECSLHYQWWHHFNPNIDRDGIWNAIQNKNYDIFIKWHEELLLEQFPYLPSEADIFIGEEWVGTVCVAYSKELFNLINSQDCECG